MESTQGGSNNLMHQRGKKTEKSRRVWTPKEEETLAAAMKEIIAQGWKSDNGFRAGYLNKLEEIFKQQLPGTDLRGNPHINSRLGTWKKNYNSLSTILSSSGVGFNLSGNFTVDCDNEKWASFEKGDTNAHKIRSKSWPLYYEWKEIFGKDRANGDGAEDITDAVNALEKEYATMFEDYIPGDYQPNFDQTWTPENGNNIFSQSHQPNHVSNGKGKKSTPDPGEPSVCQSQQPGTSSKSRGKKRKASPDGIDKVCALLTEINRNNNARWETMASRMVYDYELGQARMSIFEKLGVIPGLSQSDRYLVAEILGKSREKLEIFLGMAEIDKPGYVEHLLNYIS